MRNTKVQDIHKNERNSMKYGRLEGLSGSLTFFLNIQLAEVALWKYSVLELNLFHILS